MKSTTVVRRATLTGIAATGLLALGAAPALAHVTITPSTTSPGATTVLRVEVPHGCDGSATTGISVRLPAGVTDANAASTDRWAAEVSSDAVTFTTDDPLPDGETAVVELNVNLPDEPGTTLVLPVVQTCEEGEAAWTEIAEDGQDPEELDHPAPVVVVAGTATTGGADAAGTTDDDASGEPDVAAEADEHAGHAGHGAGDGAGDGAAGDAEAAAATGDDGAIGPWVVVGAVGVLVVGGVVGRVVLQRRRTSAP
ncbi:YcnI family protein [Isoptericola dokdonensis]|uniref:YncI copper-binding domain-containing protein n=1 Tax=Isoptericola dokdonensis DS-3 TaxID=1300344 RepID=A0A168FNI1_9MICO|nr:YcnI family protein [Isoptericola dokdonensis]ANC32199.1 hypothetical protein I598_2669 [Isoptericola dokdonensis DS-3]